MTELDALTRLVSLGTARAPETPLTEGVEAVAFRALEGTSPQKRLLLAAGVRAVASAAGQKSPAPPTPVAPAPEETLPVCSPRLATLVRGLFDGPSADRDEVLTEVFHRLARAGRRLPPELLVRALARARGVPRSAVEPVLGERGRWLARLNPAWRLPPRPQGAEVERLWAEGTFEERRRVFEDERTARPERARQWLQDTWKQEKAEHRARLLASFEPTLSPEDEPLLEQGRRDKALTVREVARHLLAQLPESAFTRRMRERALRVLRWDQGTLHVELPASWEDAEAERDGLDKPPAGVGRSEHWLVRLLECVPLPEWEQHLGATPEALVAAAMTLDDGAALSRGWSHAYRLKPSSRWASAMFDTWSREASRRANQLPAQALAINLFEQLTPSERAARTLRVLRGQETLPEASLALSRTPGPWPRELGMAWLNTVYEHPHLGGALCLAVSALPPECLLAASDAPPPPVRLAAYRDLFEHLQQLVSVFRILHEELKP
jgi:hypothetical protein